MRYCINYLNLIIIKHLFSVVGNMDYFEGKWDAPVYQKLEISLIEQKLTIRSTHRAQIETIGARSQLEILAIKKRNSSKIVSINCAN